jgi:hypothetical protein
MSQFLNRPTATQNVFPEDLASGDRTLNRMDLTIDELVRAANSLIIEAQFIVDAYSSGDQKAMWNTITSGVASGCVQSDLTRNASRMEGALNRILATIQSVSDETQTH